MSDSPEYYLDKEHGPTYICSVCKSHYIGRLAEEAAIKCAQSDKKRQEIWGVPTDPPQPRPTSYKP